MARNITLIEPLKHYEVLASILRLLAGEHINIQVFTTTFCHQHLQTQNPKIEIFSEAADRLSDGFLKSYIQRINSSEAVFFTTIDFKSRFMFSLKGSLMITGLIHNSHNNFLPLAAKRINPVRHLIRKLLGEYRRSQEVHQRLNKLLVPHEGIANYLKGNRPELSQKLLSINIAVPHYKPKIFTRNEVRIIIPGTVNQDRRDYQQVIDSLTNLNAMISQPICIIFLGKVHSKKEIKLLRQAEKLSLSKIKIEYFEDYVTSAKYSEYMQNADVLLLPIKRFIRYKSLQEERGKTCVSGNINDMVQFGLPAILPAFYPLNRAIEANVLRYSNDQELIQRVAHWVETKEYQQLKKSINYSDYLKSSREILRNALQL